MEEHIHHARNATRWNIVMAILLFAAPFIFQYTTKTASAMDDYLVAIAVFILAAIRLAVIKQTAWISWINAILGLWLIASPFVLGFANQAAIWTNIIIGAVVAALAWSSATETSKVAGVQAS